MFAIGIDNHERKKCMLLHLGGQSLQRLAKNLDTTPRVAVNAVQADPNANPPVIAIAAIPAENVYTALRRALNEHIQAASQQRAESYAVFGRQDKMPTRLLTSTLEG